MREVSVLVRRELHAYFTSPIAYVFGGLFLLVLTYFTVPNMIAHGQAASMQVFFSMLPIWFLVFVPPLTMRSWAEERKMGTLELLLTFPVTVWQVIASKFLASLIFLAFVLALTLGVPLTLSLYAQFDWGPVVTAYGAALLLAAAYISVGMFCSSITRDQLVAMLVALVVLMALTVFGTPWFQLTAENALPPWLLSALSVISPSTYFESIARGVVDTRDLLFYVCFCGFFLYLNQMALQGRRLKG